MQDDVSRAKWRQQGSICLTDSGRKLMSAINKTVADGDISARSIFPELFGLKVLIRKSTVWSLHGGAYGAPTGAEILPHGTDEEARRLSEPFDPPLLDSPAGFSRATIAGLMLTTEAMVAEKPKKETPPMTGMPPGGGMDY
jgi:hypothetical protein